MTEINPNLPTAGARPVMVMAYADSSYATRCVRMFRRLGWEVHMAASTPDTLRLVGRYAPDLVVLDGNVAEGESWKTKLYLRRDYPQQRVVVLTGRARPEVNAARSDLIFVPEDASTEGIAGSLFARPHLEAV